MAIDEFQQITQYPDGQNVEGSLAHAHTEMLKYSLPVRRLQRHLMGKYSHHLHVHSINLSCVGLAPISEDKYTEFAVH